jgi:hypothetical protein
MRTATLLVRISDNVLEDEYHSEFTLTIANNKVVDVKRLGGVYSKLGLVGKTIEQLSQWTEPDPEHNHPQTYREIYNPISRSYRDCWSVDDILDILEY